jgi:uncharacterized protein YegJ (DUF2314 family)
MKATLTEALYRKIGCQSKTTTLPLKRPLGRLSGSNFMRMVRYIAGLVLLAVVSYNFFNGPYASGSLMDKARRDDVALVEKDDPDMAAAFRKARETLPEFLALARTPRPTATNLAVKIAIPDGDGHEYFWLARFEQHGERYVGRINNTPRAAKQVKFGQVVEFGEAEIVDWLYMEGGKMRGNFTACAMLKREPPDQAEAMRKKYGLSCES